MNFEIRKVEKDELLTTLFDEFKVLYRQLYKEMDSRNVLDTDDQIKNSIDCRFENQNWFLANNDDKIVGFSMFGARECSDGNETSNLGSFKIYVDPHYRRLGVGKGLFNQVISEAQHYGVKSMYGLAQTDYVSGFFDQFGGVPFGVTTNMQLDFRKFDWPFLDSILSNKKQAGWLIKQYTSVSDEFIDQIADLSFNVSCEMDEMDGLEVVDNRKTEFITWLHTLDSLFKESNSNYIGLTLIREDGKLVGFVEGIFNRSDPGVFLQRLTAVARSYRGRDIGQYLKALMLDYLRKNHREIELVKTGCNIVNTPMIAINKKFGFYEVSRSKDYQIFVDQAVIKLGL